MGKTPSSSSTMAWWWWRSVALQQGFAKHRGRGEGREVGLRLGEVKLVCWQPQNPQIYIGEREGGVPPLGFPPQGVRLPPIPSRVVAKGGKRGNLPPKQGGAPPPQTLGALGPCGGAHQPTWGWSPPTLGPCSPPGLVAPLGGPPGPSRWSRYNTDIARNFSGDQNKTSHI